MNGTILRINNYAEVYLHTDKYFCVQNNLSNILIFIVDAGALVNMKMLQLFWSFWNLALCQLSYCL